MRAPLARLLLVVLIGWGATAAQSYTMGSATFVTGLVWSFSTAVPGLTSCTEMQLVAIGDVSRSATFGAHGALTCPEVGGLVAASGTAIIAGDGSLGLSLRVGVNSALICAGLRGFSGTCQLYSLAGQPFGPAQLSFR